jgi:hypothetical protein
MSKVLEKYKQYKDALKECGVTNSDSVETAISKLKNGGYTDIAEALAGRTTAATVTNAENDGSSSDDSSEQIDTDSEIDSYASDTITWNGVEMSYDELYQLLEEENGGTINGIPDVDSDAVETSLAGIFGMPYQFSVDVDPPQSSTSSIGRKYNEKILSIAPVLFLTPGEPVFMSGYSNEQKVTLATSLLNRLASGDDDGGVDTLDEGRYYSFTSNFPQYKRYANAALRALAYYMGISDCEVPIPGKDQTEKLKYIDIERWMNNDFTRLFGTQTTLPFFLDAETQITEDYSNDTSESILSSGANQLSGTAREIQFILGSKDGGGLAKALGNSITELGDNLVTALGDVGEAFAGRNLFSRLTSELTTIISGGKIVFPEIWAGSSFSKNYSISMKLRSPDPDPVSIFLNIYMPLVLLISMTAPRQLNSSSNAYESPFMVRATYKSIFSCDLGLITSLSISKGGEDKWNTMGQPVTADVQINVKDMYADAMFISKAYGLIANTAQMDYLATMAGVDLNIWEPFRIINLAQMITTNIPQDFVSGVWGGFKRKANQLGASLLGVFSDTRFLQ